MAWDECAVWLGPLLLDIKGAISGEVRGVLEKGYGYGYALPLQSK
jgi:hypothetical protein